MIQVNLFVLNSVVFFIEFLEIKYALELCQIVSVNQETLIPSAFRPSILSPYNQNFEA